MLTKIAQSTQHGPRSVCETLAKNTVRQDGTSHVQDRLDLVGIQIGRTRLSRRNLSVQLGANPGQSRIGIARIHDLDIVRRKNGQGSAVFALCRIGLFVRDVRRAIGTQAARAGFGQVLQEFNPTGRVPREQRWNIGTGIGAHVHENLAQLFAHKDSSIFLISVSVHFEQILSSSTKKVRSDDAHDTHAIHAQ
jgi:hypothetical protein